MQGLYTTKRIKFKGSSKFQFITKFAVGEDLTGLAQIRARFIKPWSRGANTPETIPFQLDLMANTNWDRVLDLPEDDCWGRAGQQNMDTWFNVPTNGEWTSYYSARIDAYHQTKIWYVAASDCEERMHTTVPDLPKLEIEITMTNDGSHFSQEDAYILPFYIIMFLVFAAFLGKSIMEFYRDFKSEETVENPLLPLMLSINADLMHLGLMSLHLFFIYLDGSGLFVFSVFGRLFKIISQATMMWLLITIAFGWTVTYKNMQETDIYILSAIFVIMVHLLIAALTYIDDDEHHKYHDFSGVQGFIMMFLRLIIFGVFVYGIRDTGNKAGNKQKEFLWQLTVSASFYILSFPILWLCTMNMQPYTINRFITFGTYIAQAASSYWILHQLTRKGSSYYKASHKSKTLLPGAKFD